MWPFKKKKLYRVAYVNYLFGKTFHVEVVKATDIGDAWDKIKKENEFEPISCESIQEVTSNEIN